MRDNKSILGFYRAPRKSPRGICRRFNLAPVHCGNDDQFRGLKSSFASVAKPLQQPDNGRMLIS